VDPGGDCGCFLGRALGSKGRGRVGSGEEEGEGEGREEGGEVGEGTLDGDDEHGQWGRAGHECWAATIR
jgi:hypothetical protein